MFKDIRDYGRLCSPRNDSKFYPGLFEIVPFNCNQRCFLMSRFLSEQIEEPNGSNFHFGWHYSGPPGESGCMYTHTHTTTTTTI